jgi:hypothetical protein
MTVNIDSIHDKVYIELYDIINETAFDSKTALIDDINNMKLLGLHIFEVRDFAFNDFGQCESHRILIPV